MTSIVLVETTGLTIIRLALAYTSRRHISRLYADLRNIAVERDHDFSNSSIPLSPVSPTFEHEVLPSPAISPAPVSTPSRAKFLASHATSWPSSIARSLFGVCFSESCMLFLLVTCQALNVLQPQSLMLNWRISLGVLTTLLLFVIPWLQCLLVTYRSSVSPTARVVLTLIPFVVYLFVLSFIQPPEVVNADLFSAYFARYVTLGVIALGLLSGFGATSTAWEYLLQPYFFSRSEKWRNITDADLASTELALARIQKDLHDRELTLERRAQGPDTANNGWMARVFGAGDAETKILQTETESLRALEREVSTSLGRMRRRKDELDRRGTVGGVLTLAVWRTFGVYCALRILGTAVMLVLPASTPTNSQPDTDLGARVLGWILPYVPLPLKPSAETTTLLARYLGLLLVGAILLSSLRLVLRAVGRMLKVTGRRNSGLGASVLLLFLAQLMGMYLLSTLVQLRAVLPQSELYVNLPQYQHFEPSFNLTFLGASLVTVVVRTVGWVGL